MTPQRSKILAIDDAFASLPELSEALVAPANDAQALGVSSRICHGGRTIVCDRGLHGAGHLHH